MKLDRAIAIQSELQSRILDLISGSRTYHSTHARILERYHDLFTKYPTDLPRHVKDYARGFFTALLGNYYHKDLTHGYLWKGQVHSKWDTMPEELKEVLRKDSDSIPHGHYWADTIVTGENKPFFVHEVKITA